MLAILTPHSRMNCLDALERPADNPNAPVAERATRQEWLIRQTNVSLPIDHRLDAVDFPVRHLRRTVANADQTKDAEAEIYGPPLFDDADEEIPVEQRRGRSLGLTKAGSLEATQLELIRGERFALG